MAKAIKKDKKDKPTDADNPSLIEVGGNIRLRVFEDFNIESGLPKWVRFREEWNKLKKDLGLYSLRDESDLERKIEKMTDKTDQEKSAIRAQFKRLAEMNKAVEDDRYNIRGKHEKEVDASVIKQARFIRELSLWDKIRNVFSRRKKIIPVNVAMDDLLEHIELTSTPELASKLIKLNEIEQRMRQAGQYKRADAVKDMKTIVAGEAVVCEAGFRSYITEDTMIEFLRKSERGTTVDFLRYFEDDMPQDAIDKKVAADKLMVFDNYVVAHYSNAIHKAATVNKKQNEEAERKERVKRRDPILFGVIKNSRKLYYICDWVTDTDDLTLEKLEKELGVTRISLVEGTSTTSTAPSVEHGMMDVASNNTIQYENNIRSQITDILNRAADDVWYSRSTASISSGY